MRTLRTLNYSKIFQSIITYKWLKRFLSTLHMVLLGMFGFVIMICWLLKQLLLLVSYLFVGLSVMLTSILMIFLKPLDKITFLRVIQIRFMFALTHLSVRCLMRERRLKKLSSLWMTWLDRRLSHSLRKVINVCMNM